jgi:sec-independent protein translocase protein TatA
MNLGPTELIIVLVIILVLFGARKLPDLAKGLGEGIKEFKKAQKEAAEPDTKSEGGTPPA